MAEPDKPQDGSNPPAQEDISILRRIDSVMRGVANGMTLGQADRIAGWADSLFSNKDSAETNIKREGAETAKRHSEGYEVAGGEVAGAAFDVLVGGGLLGGVGVTGRVGAVLKLGGKVLKKTLKYGFVGGAAVGTTWLAKEGLDFWSGETNSPLVKGAKDGMNWAWDKETGALAWVRDKAILPVVDSLEGGGTDGATKQPVVTTGTTPPATTGTTTPPATGAATPTATTGDGTKEPAEKNSLLDTVNFGGPAGWSPDSPTLEPILIGALQHVKNPEGRDYIDDPNQKPPTEEQRALRNLQHYLKDNGYVARTPEHHLFVDTFDEDMKNGKMGAPTRAAVQRFLHQNAGYNGRMDGKGELNSEARNAMLTMLQSDKENPANYNPDIFQKATPTPQQLSDQAMRNVAAPPKADVDAARAKLMGDYHSDHTYRVAPGKNGGPAVLVPNNPPQQENTQQQPQTATPGAMTSGAAPVPRNPGALRMENAIVQQVTPEARALGQILGGHAVTSKTVNGVEYAMVQAQGGPKGPISSPEQLRALGEQLRATGLDLSTIRTDIAQQAIAIPMSSITAGVVKDLTDNRQDVALALDTPGATGSPMSLAADTSGTKAGLGKPAAANNSPFAHFG